MRESEAGPLALVKGMIDPVSTIVSDLIISFLRSIMDFSRTPSHLLLIGACIIPAAVTGVAIGLMGSGFLLLANSLKSKINEFGGKFVHSGPFMEVWNKMKDMLPNLIMGAVTSAMDVMKTLI